MKLDFVAILAFVALFAGVVLLLCKFNCPTSAARDYAVPSKKVTGGWIPGGTTKGWRNGGVGATQPEVWWN
jgi:hypothetical protein